jgi:hypothetical protein
MASVDTAVARGLEPGRVTRSTYKKQGKYEKQILIGQGVLETSMWKL